MNDLCNLHCLLQSSICLQCRNMEQKKRWCGELKRLILESYSTAIPDKVKELVMTLGKSKEEQGTRRKHLGIFSNRYKIIFSGLNYNKLYYSYCSYISYQFLGTRVNNV